MFLYYYIPGNFTLGGMELGSESCRVSLCDARPRLPIAARASLALRIAAGSTLTLWTRIKTLVLRNTTRLDRTVSECIKYRNKYSCAVSSNAFAFCTYITLRSTYSNET